MPGKYQLRNTYLVALSIFGLHTTFNHCKNLKYNICSLCCYESLNCCLSDLYVKICKISWITFINLFYQNFNHRMMSFIWMWVVDVCLLYIFYMYFIYIHLRKFVFCNFIYELHWKLQYEIYFLYYFVQQKISSQKHKSWIMLCNWLYKMQHNYYSISLYSPNKPDPKTTK